MLDEDLQKKLELIAYKKTTPFCYGCYIEAPTGVCPRCGSDDLMRLMKSVGCVDWVIRELIRQNLKPVDLDDQFSQCIESGYGETVEVGFMEFPTVKLMKDNHPDGWRCALADYVSETEGETLVTFDKGDSYYHISDVESFIKENETEGPSKVS